MGERDKRFSWLDALGFTQNNTFAGAVLFVGFCLIGILYIGYQTLEPKECICSWSFLNSFVIVLGKKLGILGTSSLMATLILVTVWRIYKNLKEAIRAMWSDQFKNKVRAEGRARGKAEAIQDILDNSAIDLTDEQREELKRERRDLLATASR